MSKGGIFAKIKGTASDGSSKKMLIGAGVAIAGAVGYAMWPAPETGANPAIVAKGPSQETVQGGSLLTPVYTEQVKKNDEQRKQEAIKTGGSTIPTVVLGGTGEKTPIMIHETDPEPAKPPEVTKPVLAPLEQRPVIMAPPVQAVPIVAPPAPTQVGPDPAQLGAVMAQFAKRTYAVADVQYMYSAPAAAQPTQSAPAVSASAAAGPASRVKLPLAGDILYAQIVGRANSDAPGPVTARILQGPLAGATLIGTFSTGRDALVITFNKMTVRTTPDGEEVNETVDIEAVAVDTKYIGTALASSVDRHLFQKIGIGLAASFAEGFGKAISQSNSTSTYRSDGSYTTSSEKLSGREQLMSAGGHAIASTGNILMDEFGRRPTTIIVDSETPIGVLFL